MLSVHGPETMMTPHTVKDQQRPTTPETLPGTVSSCSLDEIAAAAAAAANSNSNNNNNLVILTTTTTTTTTTAGTTDQDDSREQQQEQQNVVAMSPVSTTNNTAPSSVCQQRRLSAAIVTGSNPDSASHHDYVAGRPIMTVEDLSIPVTTTTTTPGSSTPTTTRNSSENRPQMFQTPPKPPSQKHHRGASTSVPRRHVHRDSETHKSLTRQTSTPSSLSYGGLLNDPHPMRVDGWGEAPTTHYEVRGPNYLSDRIKQPSDTALFSLLTVDIIRTADDKPILDGLCNHPDERIQRALRREQQQLHQLQQQGGDASAMTKELPDFVWAINLAVPGPPFYHVMLYFGCDDVEALMDTSTPVGRLTKRFFFGNDDEFRDNTFKLIPRIVEGNYIVKKAVGTKPAILGRKLKQHYIRHPRFMELIVDISSDSIAKNVTGLSVGYAKQLITDMMFVLEGDTEDTLPERILGGVRFKHIDFKKRDGKRVVHNYRA